MPVVGVGGGVGGRTVTWAKCHPHTGRGVMLYLSVLEDVGGTLETRGERERERERGRGEEREERG